MLYKFRTMTDARNENGELLPDAERLTPLGQKIRSSSLDELPQLFNVLKGEMSLVGPRPLLLDYVPLYNKEQKRRLEVPQGITGWAQINGRNATETEQRAAAQFAMQNLDTEGARELLAFAGNKDNNVAQQVAQDIADEANNRKLSKESFEISQSVLGATRGGDGRTLQC